GDEDATATGKFQELANTSFYGGDRLQLRIAWVERSFYPPESGDAQRLQPSLCLRVELRNVGGNSRVYEMLRHAGAADRAHRNPPARLSAILQLGQQHGLANPAGATN